MAAEPSDLLQDQGDDPGRTLGDAPGAGPVADLVDRVTGGRGRKKKTADEPPAAPVDERLGAEQTPPKTRRRSGTTGAERARRAKDAAARKSVAGGFAAIYGQLGALALNAGDPELVPFGRAMQVNAPVAGRAFDELVKGTAVDRVLQPVADRGDEVRNFANAVLFPGLILAMTKRPELAPTLEPMAYSLFASNIVAMGPVVAEKKKQDQAAAKVLREMATEGMLPTGPNGEAPSLRELFEMLFAPTPEMEAEPFEPGAPPPAEG